MRESRTERHELHRMADQADRARLGPALGKPRFTTPPQRRCYGPRLFTLSAALVLALACAAIFTPV